MSLDEKLRDITNCVAIHGVRDEATQALTPTEAVEAIKQAFIETLPEEAKRVFLENLRYHAFYGEIPEKHGGVDVLTAYETYKDNEDFQQNFGRYVEAVKTKLEANDKETEL